jgi:hypothetical protein
MHSGMNHKLPPTGNNKPKVLIVPEKYQAVQEAILAMLPTGGEGITWTELAEMIAPYLPESLFRHTGTVRWYTRAVQMDLEAQGVIEQVPGSHPLRLRRVA